MAKLNLRKRVQAFSGLCALTVISMAGVFIVFTCIHLIVSGIRIFWPEIEKTLNRLDVVNNFLTLFSG